MAHDTLAHDYIVFARQLSTSGSYNKAFDYYMMAFEKCPDLKGPHELEFRGVMSNLNEFLVSANKMEDIFINFERATRSFRNNTYFLNELGKYLYKYAFYEEAWSHFQKALKLDSGLVNAEKNLNSLKNFVVERWHFRMLNDKIRNEAYKTAIRETLIPYKDSVLDLGTGTGLLSMYAYDCAPMAITACDGSEVMAKLANAITVDNGYDQILVVRKMSTSMDHRDIGGKKSLVITEMFDAGLFGEHILKTLSHAWDNLISSTGRVIPNKAEFFIVGAKCDYLSSKYHLSTSIKSILNVSTLNVHILTEQETYDCEDLHLFGDDIYYMTQAKSVVKIDFNNPCEIQDTLKRTEPYKIELKPLINGELNIYIGWFKLYLTENVTIASDPRFDIHAKAWQQAVFYDNIPKTVNVNDTINIEFLMNGGKLTMLPEVNSQITRVSQETIRFLNDAEYMNMISGCIGMASVYLGQMAEMSQINVIDLCPFPMFGLQLLKRGIQSLICHAKTDSDEHFFKEVLKANNIPLSKVTILVGNDWPEDTFKDENYHAIFCNILELCGEIDVHLKEITQNLRQNHLLPGGLFVPENIKIICQIVDSEWLDINNRIFDENVSNYKIAEYLHKYQVTQHFHIDFAHLKYTALSDMCVIGTSNNPEGTEAVSVSLLRQGNPNAILCWYSIELFESVTEITTNRKFSFIDGMAFMANRKIDIQCGENINLLRCVDPDGSFKIMMMDVS